MILRHRAKRTIPFGRMLNRIVAIHGKRAPTMAQLRTRVPQSMWGTFPRFCKLAAHHDWTNAGRSEVLRAHQHLTQGAPLMTKMKSLEDLFINLLKDMYYAEKQILKALPKMAKHADSSVLRRAFENHLKETEGHVERLEQVFALCDTKAAGKTCPAIKGILE